MLSLLNRENLPRFEPLQFLEGLKHCMHANPKNSNFLMFSDDEIHMLNVNPHVSRTWQLIVATEAVKPARVKPIIGHDCVYFVLSNIDTQSDDIMMIRSVALNAETRHLDSLKCVYTQVESSIVAMQLCNDTQHQVDQDYNQDGSIKPTTLSDRIELLVLDSSCNLIKLKELNGKLEQVYCKRLANIR